MNKHWQTVALGEVSTAVERPEIPDGTKTYRQLGVRLWGQGAYERESINGLDTSYKTLSRVETNDIVVNRIWARNGSVSIVPSALSGCYVSSEFPTFQPDLNQLIPEWIYWLTKTRYFWNQCDIKSRGTSGQNRIKSENFLQIPIPIPPLHEQRRIVARIEALAAKTDEVNKIRQEIIEDNRKMLLGVYHKIIENADYQPMAKVAPLARRPVTQINNEKYYPELGVRSFGNGTFHKAAIKGVEMGTKRIFEIKPNDLIFSNVFAWEGAIAVAKPEDKDRFGSHRFITCVPKENVALSTFLAFHFLTQKGLEQIGDASPGGAGRNRTLGLTKLEALKVPVPSIEKQQWFDSLLQKTNAIKKHQSQTRQQLNALMPAILDKAFKGKL